MAQLRRLAIAAEDPRRLADFYMQVFELEKVQEAGSVVCLSDGVFNLAFFKPQAGHRSGLYSKGFKLESAGNLTGLLGQKGVKTMMPPPGLAASGIQLELADPDGNVVDVAQTEFSASQAKTPFPIRHIALYTPDPQRLADFYTGLFEMKESARSDRSSVFVSDGYFNLALLSQRREEPLGLHHFGFHVQSIEEIQGRFEGQRLTKGSKRPDRIPYAEYRMHDPEGNGIDISVKGWDV